MLLRLNEFDEKMKLVYRLSDELKTDPEQVILAQALTLDESKPYMGLKGTHGLFGSKEWWDSIYQEKMPLLFLSGIIDRSYFSGQDSLSLNNTIDILSNDGKLHTTGIYTNNKSDIALFKKGARVAIVYALDELKKSPTKKGQVNFSEIALEVAVSDTD